MAELDPAFYEKPYFVVPENDQQAEAFAVVRKALQSTRKAAIGKIAFSGREHLVAISALPESKEDTPATRGLMAYTLRYAEELRKPAEYFSEIKKVSIDSDQLSLAKELIKRKAAKFDPDKFTDQYEVALRELIEAKIKHLPIPHDRARKEIRAGHQPHGCAPQERQRRCRSQRRGRIQKETAGPRRRRSQRRPQPGQARQISTRPQVGIDKHGPLEEKHSRKKECRAACFKKVSLKKSRAGRKSPLRKTPQPTQSTSSWARYQSMRDFNVTAEPSGKEKSAKDPVPAGGLPFVIRSTPPRIFTTTSASAGTESSKAGP